MRSKYSHVHLTLVGACLLCVSSCRFESAGPDSIPAETLFTLMPPAYTRVDFANRLHETQDFNVFTYRNYHNGGGVAVADFNNDGLPDLYFTANQESNRLYLNEGDFRFRDVTRRAGVGGKRPWSTGVAVADVNGDGWLDIYVSAAGQGSAESRANELFINQGPDRHGVPRFIEAGADWGIADQGFSIQGAFLDYDLDGDLDLYVVNNSPRPPVSFGIRNTRHVRDPHGGDRLYRNDGDRFTDVTEEAGILSGEIAFGLDVTITDVNADGLPDIFVSNDFFERDYLYINTGRGSFHEDLEGWMRQTSLSSMGADAADLDNDGYPEIYVTDMLPQSDTRLKRTSTFESWDHYQQKVRSGFYHQFMRNTLQRNNGDSFTEIGPMAGVEATDWSWGTLLADFDLDGRKDIFVTNGVFRDVTDQDFIDFLSDEDNARAMSRPGRGIDFRAVIERIPSHRLPNVFFHNQSEPGRLTFIDRAEEMGLGEPGFSSGCVYADLDGDGDLDIVINNVNQGAFVYRNEANVLLDHHFLRIELKGEPPNTFGVGARVSVHAGGSTQYLENFPVRGFQSTVDHVLVVGLGEVDRVDSLVVRWQDGRRQVVMNPPIDETITVRQTDVPPTRHAMEEGASVRLAAGEGEVSRTLPSADKNDDALALQNGAMHLRDITQEVGLQHTHRENDFVDFIREPLLVKMYSREGPATAVGDLNGDGLDDIFIGGAKGFAGRILLQERSGRFRPVEVPDFEADALSEDVGASFFDADGDGDLDLYVVSGGVDYSSLAPPLADRLYINDGRGGFSRTERRLPLLYESGSVVRPHDFDGDGDLDLFVGGRLVPWRYGLPPRSVLIQNDGHGRFTDVTDTVAPDLADIGMVTDAVWADVDGDGRLDLVLVGDWMPITIFLSTPEGLRRAEFPGLENTSGWWNRIVAHDLDGDGDIDFVAGNLGLNSRLRATPEEPLELFIHDYDRNGFIDQVMAYHADGHVYPLALRPALLDRLPFLEERFPTYLSYAGKRLDEVFTPSELAGVLRINAQQMASVVLINEGDSLTVRPLPAEAQIGPIYGIAVLDATGDGVSDLYVGGGHSAFKPEIGPMIEGRGALLAGLGDGTFEAIPRAAPNLQGDVRHILPIRSARAGSALVITRSGGPVQILEVR